MSDLQQSPVPAQAAMPAMVDAPAPAFEDADYAFGCECADPALQIAWWGQEARNAAADGAS